MDERKNRAFFRIKPESGGKRKCHNREPEGVLCHAFGVFYSHQLPARALYVLQFPCILEKFNKRLFRIHFPTFCRIVSAYLSMKRSPCSLLKPSRQANDSKLSGARSSLFFFAPLQNNAFILNFFIILTAKK